jgi:hypothetical protein
MGKIAQALVAILVVSLTLSGCIWLLWEDFDKATLVGELDLGGREAFRRSVTLPSGDAGLILAVPNYRCAPLEGEIRITVHSLQKLEFSEHRPFSEFLWSHSRDGCDAYGFLRSYIRDERGEPKRLGMDLQLPPAQNPIVVEIDTSQIGKGTGRVALVWFVYGDRVPGARIFGKYAEPLPSGMK